MHCRNGEHELPPECPHGHGRMVITPRGERARCPVLTGRDERGRTTWCGALRDAVTYGPDGQPVHQSRQPSTGRTSCHAPLDPKTPRKAIPLEPQPRGQVTIPEKPTQPLNML